MGSPFISICGAQKQKVSRWSIFNKKKKKEAVTFQFFKGILIL